MFLYHSFDKWLRMQIRTVLRKLVAFWRETQMTRRQKPLVRIKHNQQQTKAIFQDREVQAGRFLRKIARVGLFLRSDHFSWGGSLMNCLIKEKKNFDFGVNFAVHRNRKTLLAMFSLLIKPLGQISSAIMIQLLNFETKTNRSSTLTRLLPQTIRLFHLCNECWLLSNSFRFAI